MKSKQEIKKKIDSAYVYSMNSHCLTPIKWSTSYDSYNIDSAIEDFDVDVRELMLCIREQIEELI